MREITAEQHFLGACRYKDKTKSTMEIGNVDDFTQAREAMLNQPQCKSALVLVPKHDEVVEKEYA